jgi:hypothetical protein
MWRAFFCAIGIVLLILGVECLMIDSAILAAGVVDEPMPPQNVGLFGAGAVPPQQSRTFRPAEWIPWSLLTSGAVTLLYALSLRRNQG